MSALFADLAAFAPLAVLGASFAGSMHCAAMCGPISLGAARGLRAQAAYHGGRLAAYSALGAVSGGAGHALLSDGAPLWISLGSAVLIGSALVVQGLKSWPRLGFARFKIPHLKVAKFGGRVLSRILTRSRSDSTAVYLQAGMATAFLPCGWLYTFIAAAATTQSSLRGAGLMFAFWAGTVPALSVGTWAVQRWIGPIARRFPRAVGLLLIFAGMSTIGAKLSAATGGFTHVPQASHSCHETRHMP